MTPPSAASDPTPPIRELPAEVEEVIEQFGVTCHVCGMDEDPPHLVWAVGEEKKKLRNAIRAALDERDTALRASAQLLGATLAERDEVRERCERLRRVADVASLCGTTPDIVLEALADLHEDDYADDLRPRGGDER